MRAAELPADEPWLCPGCAAKDAILDEVNDQCGTSYELDVQWKDVFAQDMEEAEKAAEAKGGTGLGLYSRS